MTMDDPTTYLTRDASEPVVVLAGNLGTAQLAAREYGCSVQAALNSHASGIRVVSNSAEATDTIAALPASTPWCVVADGLWDQHVFKMLRAWFGPPVTMAEALNVTTDGIAWRPDTFAVKG